MTVTKHKVSERWDEVNTYFAILPRKDVNGDWFWLEKYYYMEELHFGGYICFRGRTKEFSSKKEFWMDVVGRSWI